MTKREQVLQAVLAKLVAAAGSAKVLRNADVPTSVSPEGLVIMRDGDPGEPEVTLSPLAYTFNHVVTIEVYAQASAKTVRVTALDDLLAAIGSALAADPTFGGLAEFSMPGGAASTDSGATGAQSVASATVPFTVIYTTSNPLQ